MGLTAERIANQPQLLGRKPETLRGKLKDLLRDGINRTRLSADPALLAMKRGSALKRARTHY